MRSIGVIMRQLGGMAFADGTDEGVGVYVLGGWREVSGLLPGPGGVSSWVTHRELTAVDLLALMVARGVVDLLAVCSFSVSAQAGDLLAEWLDAGRVRMFRALISPAAERLQEAGGYGALRELGRRYPDRARVREADVHAKVYLCDMADGNCFVVESSANLARNSRVELYTVWNSQKRLESHMAWMERFLV